jgi:DNA-binding response OmpR family regulator
MDAVRLCPDVAVIEDDEAIRDLVVETLADEGYRVIGIPRGGEALATVLTTRPRLVLLDRHLGDRDGAAVLAELKRHQGLDHIPVVLMSASATVHTEAAELRADGVLAKPFQIDALIACVAAFLAQPSALRMNVLGG